MANGSIYRPTPQEWRDMTQIDEFFKLAIERTGWRRYLFGRWVYSSEPFRRDIQRSLAKNPPRMMLNRWERVFDPADEWEASDEQSQG